MEQNMNLVFLTDNRYFRQTVVAMTSVVRAMQKCKQMKIYLIDDGISDDNFKLLNTIISKWDSCICLEIIKIDKKETKNLRIHGHVTRTAYAKMYLPELIPEKWVIYLDGDVICNEDISQLWGQMDEAYSLCAVINYEYQYDNDAMGLPHDTITFNSGVMLMNLEKMRVENASRKLWEATERFHATTLLHDQAVFNYVFLGDWKPLDIQWNFQKNMFKYYKRMGLTKAEHEAVVSDPAIIHYTTASKPWLFRCAHPYREVFVDIYVSLFGELIFPDRNIISLMKKTCEKLGYIKNKIANCF